MRELFKRLNPAQMVFWGTVAFAVFLVGGIFGNQNLQPFRLFNDGFTAARDLYRQFRAQRHELSVRIRYPGDGVVQHIPGKAFDGLTLVEGVFPEGVELRLIDMSGAVLHRWPVSFSDIWPDPSHVLPTELPASSFHYFTHGNWLLPDGDVIFNVSKYGTVRMDKCGNVKWTLDRISHHSITPDSGGNFWVPVRADPDTIPGDYLDAFNKTPGTEAPGDLVRFEERLLLVTGDGDVLRELSVLKAVLDSDLDHQLFNSLMIDEKDLTHVNDIDVVTPPLAEKIDGVSAGDLLVSIRQMHTVAIMDRESGHIKWHKTGPWIRQHDPDISKDGNIVVFDNGGDHRPKGENRSRIVSLDPATNETTVLYPLEGDAPFYTSVMGAHQLLPNGNRLITESKAGRLFEIDPQREIVWEYIKPYDDTHAALFETAVRFEPGYFSIQDWNCSDGD